jgi:hypothetical protein
MPLKALGACNAFTDPMPIGRRSRVLLATSISPTDEIFASLAYVSEVKKVGRELLLRLGHPKPEVDDTFRIFRSFIRQARTFYESARTLHHRASALIYYYSFLNLAKALICLTDPKAVSGKISHGLFYRFRHGKLASQSLGVEAKGVYRSFYEKVTSYTLPQTFRPNIGRLLTYCSDIAYECEHSGFGQHRALPCRHRLLIDTEKKVAFSVLAVAHFERVEPYKKALKPCFAYYEEGDVSQKMAAVASYFDLTV